MGIKYGIAEDLQEIMNEIASMLFPHVKIDSVICLRSVGSSSRGVIARCHALGKAMQMAMGRKGFYVIEVISERFDNQKKEDQIRTLIHELMHIPKSFGGGFKYHDYVTDRNVEVEYQRYVNLKKKEEKNYNNAEDLIEEANEVEEVEEVEETNYGSKKWW
ncbi:metallopeptidase [archaeon]|nr:metallopeptidase [archaeon]MBT4242021.1 metallopeptidase [archaeon]